MRNNEGPTPKSGTPENIAATPITSRQNITHHFCRKQAHTVALARRYGSRRKLLAALLGEALLHV